ncbi:MAG TPA: S41 family peptidase, partial [Gemmataceae bacterium]|nr:S41 family peptidase [Gemmataceae bacterium]
MSRIIAPLVVVLGLGPALAAPRDKSPSPEALAAGDQFTRQLAGVAQLIVKEYVRPVKSVALYEAAIEGLYDAARRPRPATLLRDLRAVKTDADLVEIVKRARAAVHGEPALDDGRDLVAAVTAFTRVLDPHTVLIPSGVLNGTTTANTYGFEFEGEAGALPARRGRTGRGVSDLTSDDAAGVPPIPFRVATVKPGSPAQKAGLRPGDIVREVNGVAADVQTAVQAFAALHGPGADKADPGMHTLLVDRAGRRDPLRLRLTREDFTPESLFGVTRAPDNTWDYWLDREARIAYVRLGAIENGSGDQLSELLHGLGHIRGLVFDLRWCPGGYIDPATQIASIFLDSGLVARMKYRNPDRGENSEIQADGGLIRYKAGNYPVLLLVNGETVGGGELIVAALRDNGRAVVAGT